MRRLVALLTAGAALCALAPRGAWAAGEIEGQGFRARAPVGFRPSGETDEDDHSVRRLTRRLESGLLELELSSTRCEGVALARLELEAGRAFEALSGLVELGGGEVERVPARVLGAEEAYEIVVSGEEGSVRTLAARRGERLLTATLRAPARAEEEAEEAWRALKASLRAEEPRSPVGTILVGTLAGLVLLTLGLTWRQRARRAAERAPLPGAPAPAPSPAAVEAAPAEPPIAPLPPTTTPVRRVHGGSLSRADDGLPTFAPGTRSPLPGTGAEAGGQPGDPAQTLRLPELRRKPAPPPAPPRAPNLAPPSVRLARPVPGPAGEGDAQVRTPRFASAAAVGDGAEEAPTRPGGSEPADGAPGARKLKITRY